MTTMLNISLPQFDTLASMRALQDEDNDEATVRPLINTWGWDPGKDEVHVRPPEETFHDPPPSSLFLATGQGCEGCILYTSHPCAGSMLLSMLLPPPTTPF
jgi:hypothetical protein